MPTEWELSSEYADLPLGRRCKRPDLSELPDIYFPFPNTPSATRPHIRLRFYSLFILYLLFYLLHCSQETSVAPNTARAKQIHEKAQIA